MIRVLIADDHAIVRRGLTEILEDEPDLVAAGEARTAGAVLRAVRGDDIDVLLLDLAMPGGGGLEVLRQLQTLRPNLPVLVLSVHAERLVEAIRHVARGEKYITPSVGELLADRLEDRRQLPHMGLSDREFQVLCMLASGDRVGEIAEKLSLSAKTVSTYRSRILDKLHLDGTADIIRYALEHDLTV